MPYVAGWKRMMISKAIKRRSLKTMGQVPQDAGELNYTITKIIAGYIKSKGLSYNTLNEVIGALECAKMELYRRVVTPYEEDKIEENGDVY